MNTLTSLNLRAKGVMKEESRALGLAPFEQWMDSVMGGYAASSGVHGTPDTAMQVSAVYACVRVLAETVATLPVFVYRRTADGGKSRESGHPLYRLLHDKPNKWQTSVEWREMMMGHLALRGNAYSMIGYSQTDSPSGLIPLHPDTVEVKQINGEMAYGIRNDDGTVSAINPRNILHLRGVSSDGIVDISPIGLAREAIGLAKATEEYGAKLFLNYGKPGGILQHPGKLSPDAALNLKKSWQEIRL